MESPLFANLVAPEFRSNSCFDLAGPLNRDNGLISLVKLRDVFLSKGIILNTPDINQNKPIDFELHINVQATRPSTPAYLLMLETQLVHPLNGCEKKLLAYNSVFTWNDDILVRNSFIKINFPNELTVPQVDGYAKRNLLCCVIASNKAAVLNSPLELYTERVRAIRWFESNAPEDFALFGVGWDLPPARSGILGKVEKRLWRLMSSILRFRPFTSYRGKIIHKREVLSRSRFSLCYENVRDLSGYITEKIFDCFFAGCVPVYWGANNVKSYIPPKCFIDRRDFADTADVYDYLKAMDEETYRSYQEEIIRFLSSSAAKPFSAEVFAETIVSNIIQDLNGAQ